MSKFCGKCGSILNENGLCPKCDFVQMKTEDEQNAGFKDISGKKQKNKSKGKAIKVIALILAVVIVAGGTVGALSYFNIVDIPVISSILQSSSSNTTEKNYVIENNGNKYYIGGFGVAKLEKDDSVTAVHYEDAEEVSSEITDDSTNLLCLSVDKSVYDGDTIYAQSSAYRELYKFTFKDDKTAERSVWVNEETLNNSDVVTKKENSDLGYTGNMTCWRLDGDYIYFIYAPGMDYFMSERDVAYRLGRICKDGSSIEFIGDEIASSYTVKDGWIYYYDNGYTYNESLSKGYEIDYDRAGIYKMRGDGSQKQRLVSDLGKKGIESSYNDVCDKMEIFGDYLYFLDYSSKGKSRVCRMKTDGSDLEYVSENGAYSYTIDVENNTLYYITGEYGQTSLDSRNVYKASLDIKNDEVLFEYGQYGGPDFTVYNDYLYFSNTNFSIDFAGLKYNLKTSEYDKLVGYYEREEITDGIFTKHVTHGPYLNWEKYVN